MSAPSRHAARLRAALEACVRPTPADFAALALALHEATAAVEAVQEWIAKFLGF